MKNYLKSIKNLFLPISNVEEIAQLVAKMLQVKVTDSFLSHQIEIHPDFPSLSSIRDVFSRIGIDSTAIHVHDAMRIKDVSEGFIAQVTYPENNKNLTYIYLQTEDFLIWHNPVTHKRESVSRETFNRLFTGYVMLFEKEDDSGQEDYKHSRRIEIVQLLITLCAVLFFPIASLCGLIHLWFSQVPFVWSDLVLTILLLVGCIVGQLLLLYEVNTHNPALSKFCSVGKKSNCAAILFSKASHFFGISWTVIGNAYFAGLLLCILITEFHPNIIHGVYFIHLFALPYIAYSLFYQYHKAKQWCPLCLTIILVIFLIFVNSLCSGWLPWHGFYSLHSFFDIFLCIAVSFFTYFFIEKFANYYKHHRYLKRSLSRIKNDKEVFHALLHKKSHVNIPKDLGIYVGNPDGSIHIVKFCNPYCGHCASAQKVLHTLLERNSEIKVQMIFVINPATPYYQKTPIDLFLSLYHEGQNIETVLNDWYALPIKDINAFRLKHNVAESNTEQNRIEAEKMFKCSQKLEIKGTPTIYINGHQLPDEYSIEDLIYIL